MGENSIKKSEGSTFDHPGQGMSSPLLLNADPVPVLRAAFLEVSFPGVELPPMIPGDLREALTPPAVFLDVADPVVLPSGVSQVEVSYELVWGDTTPAATVAVWVEKFGSLILSTNPDPRRHGLMAMLDGELPNWRVLSVEPLAPGDVTEVMGYPGRRWSVRVELVRLNVVAGV